MLLHHRGTLGQDRRVFAVERPQNGGLTFAAVDRVRQHVDQNLNTKDIAQQNELLTLVITSLASTSQIVAGGHELAVLQFHVFAESVQMRDQRCHDFALARVDVAVFSKCRNDDVGDVVDRNDTHKMSSSSGVNA